ncbi:MAG: type II toxin-antitoxin system PemK/MazF family toxin [Anaerolineae bacterium]|nr:type II toxin-antitoxin system PemK/MazF family toxin [Anaerolineae bacterium]
MAYQRGEVLLVPFPFSDLSATKVRPAIVVSSPLYHANEPDIILAAITSQITTIGPLDCVLQDWQTAGLRFPSAFKPVLFTLEPSRVIFQVGSLSHSDLMNVEIRLRRMLAL